MDISNLEDVLQLKNNVYFTNLEKKENSLYILPDKDAHSYKSTSEMLDIHMKLEPLNDMYDIVISFDEISITPKSEMYE